MMNGEKNLSGGLNDLDRMVVMLMQGIPLPMFLINVDGAISFANPAFSEMSGYPTDELTGQKPPFAFWPDQPSDFTELLVNRTIPSEQQLKKKNGTTIWTEIRATPVNNEDQRKYFIVSCVDISRQKISERALLAAKLKFDIVFNALPFPAAISTLPERTLLEVNDTFLETTGFSRDELVGRSTVELPWYDSAENARNPANIDVNEEIVQKEIDLVSKDGSQHTALLSTRNITIDGEGFLLGVAADITDRKRAEIALKESEAFTSSLLRNSTNPIVVTDYAGKVKYANPAFVSLTGFSEEEIIGSEKPYRWWPPDLIEEYSNFREKMGINQPDNLEIRLMKKNGEAFWVRVSHRQIRQHGEVRHYLNNWLDITENKKAFEALRDSEKNFRDSMENSPLGIRIVNAQGDTLFANKAFLCLYGYSTLEEFLAVSTRDRYTEASYQEYLLRKNKRKQGIEVPSPYELDISRKSGEIRRLSVSRGEVIWNNHREYQVIYQDITEKSHFESALRMSEEKFRTLFETMAQGIIYLDDIGRVVSANPAAEDIMGLTVVEMHKDALAGLKKAVIREDGSDFPKSEQPGMMALKTGENIQNVVMGVFNPVDKKYRWVNANAVPRFNYGESRPYQVYLTLSDITELKEAQALSFETEALKRVNRMKTDLLANVSHELRTPLSSIKGFLETLLEPDVSWSHEQQLDFLESANREADRLTFLIRDLLDMSRLDSGKMSLDKQPVKVEEIMETADNVLKVVAKEHDLRIRAGRSLPRVNADKYRIAQVITNLVENACKFSQQGARVDITVKKAGGNVVFIVKDRGIGMSEDTLGHLFNRFYQAQQVVSGKTRGTGLGLPISKGIVESHGGQIQVTSRLNEGSVFSFSLPVDQDKAAKRRGK